MSRNLKGPISKHLEAEAVEVEQDEKLQRHKVSQRITILVRNDALQRYSSSLLEFHASTPRLWPRKYPVVLCSSSNCSS